MSLSFNAEGASGTFFRYIGDDGTYVARYDHLFSLEQEQIELSHQADSMNGIVLQDRAFLSAIREGHAPNASVAHVLPCYPVLPGAAPAGAAAVPLTRWVLELLLPRSVASRHRLRASRGTVLALRPQA